MKRYSYLVLKTVGICLMILIVICAVKGLLAWREIKSEPITKAQSMARPVAMVYEVHHGVSGRSEIRWVAAVGTNEYLFKTSKKAAKIYLVTERDMGKIATIFRTNNFEKFVFLPDSRAHDSDSAMLTVSDGNTCAVYGVEEGSDPTDKSTRFKEVIREVQNSLELIPRQ